MDNLTHSLVGWALGATGLARRTRKGMAACILAANMPDIDVFFGWSPWPPLAMHRGFTHGLIGGVLVMPPMLAGLLWLFDRWQLKRGSEFRSQLSMRFGWLVVLCYLGALTHPLLDWQNTYAVQLFSPATTRWFHNDALFIVDPWVWGTLAMALMLSRWRRERGKSFPGAPAVVALGLLVGYVTLNAGISVMAQQAAASEAPYANPERFFASPEPLAFWRRSVVWREGDHDWRGTYDPIKRPTALTSWSGPEPVGMNDPAVRLAATANPEIIHFLRWSVMPTAALAKHGCIAKVRFGDARFADRMTVASFRHDVTVNLCAAGL